MQIKLLICKWDTNCIEENEVNDNMLLWRQWSYSRLSGVNTLALNFKNSYE